MAPEHFDVLIVGAGLSGIGAAVHLKRRCPRKTFTIVEARDAIGGTWDLFRYPGVRSDSDMFTLAYSFRPWKQAKAIADGRSILEYVRDTARAFGIERSIRFGHRVTRAAWSSADARWTVELEHALHGQRLHLTCGFLYFCTGYYRYDTGYLPDFPGRERFAGTIVHPQHWPDGLDVAGRRVVVIGSGATAVTLVPALAEKAAHVTMLQRSPSYVLSVPSRDVVADALRRWLPAAAAHRLLRWKNVLIGMALYELCRRRPELAKKLLRSGAAAKLPQDYAVDRAFQAALQPVAAAAVLGARRRLVHRAARRPGIDRDRPRRQLHRARHPSGVRPRARRRPHRHRHRPGVAGARRCALAVDGRDVDLAATLSYRGVMWSGVPNAAACLGYTNASWTLRADLVSRFVCRLLNHMERARAARLRAAHAGRVDATAAAERLLVRVLPARFRFAAEAGHEVAVATAPELHRRPHRTRIRAARRRGDRVLVGALDCGDGNLRLRQHPAVAAQVPGASRSECDTSVEFGGRRFRLPVVPANMKTVIDEPIAEMLAAERVLLRDASLRPRQRRVCAAHAREGPAGVDQLGREGCRCGHHRPARRGEHRRRLHDDRHRARPRRQRAAHDRAHQAPAAEHVRHRRQRRLRRRR